MFLQGSQCFSCFLQVGKHMVKCLEPFQKKDVKYGFISNKDDFKYLARKVGRRGCGPARLWAGQAWGRRVCFEKKGAPFLRPEGKRRAGLGVADPLSLNNFPPAPHSLLAAHGNHCGEGAVTHGRRSGASCLQRAAAGAGKFVTTTLFFFLLVLGRGVPLFPASHSSARQSVVTALPFYPCTARRLRARFLTSPFLLFAIADSQICQGDHEKERKAVSPSGTAVLS